MKGFTRWFCAAVLAVAAATSVQAGLIPAMVTIQPDGGNHRFVYSIVLPSNYQVKNGDFFTIYDFHGFVPSAVPTPLGWTFSSSPTGINPPGIVPNDDPLVTNLTWVYSGPTLTGQQGLGNFMAVSTFSGTILDSFASRDFNLDSGKPVSNITTVEVPDPQSSGIPDAPEPASLALFGIAVPIAGLFRWLRRRGESN
jgi:hypothetical protein